MWHPFRYRCNNGDRPPPNNRKKSKMSNKRDTHKATIAGKRETLARRAARAAKYASATTLTRSARPQARKEAW